MHVAALQFDVTLDADSNRAVVGGFLKEAAQRGIELVVLPEMWASSFPGSGSASGGANVAARAQVDRAAADWLREQSAALGLAIAGSALALEGERLFNRLQLFEAGEERLRYDKVHLFTPTAEHEVFSAGDAAPQTVQVAGALVSGAVCYDLRFPEIMRVPFRAGVQVQVVSAQWPTPRHNQWRALCIARAVENQCFVVGCNRTGTATIGRRKIELFFPGNSLIVSPFGEILAEGQGKDGLVAAQLDLTEVHSFRTRVPVLKDERADLYRRWLDTE